MRIDVRHASESWHPTAKEGGSADFAGAKYLPDPEWMRPKAALNQELDPGFRWDDKR